MSWRWVFVAVGILVSAVCALPASAAPPDAPTACKIDRPDGLWPGDYVNDWDTNLHHGLNSDWTKQVRPVGTVKALMIFVDFPDAQATNANPNQGGYDWRVPQSYWDFLKPAVDMFKQSSNGRFDLKVDLAPQWHRMPAASTTYGMTRATFSIANQKAYARAAVQAADPQVDFAGYDLVYIMPPRNATQIAFSPELNLYSDQILADGNVVKNGATYGQDMFTWGPKIIKHETGHAISLPESYNGSGTGATHLWVGGWDLMGNILGHAPEFMSWNKWKLGWLDDPDFGCLAGDGTAEYDLSPVSTASDGGVTKKGVVIKTSPTTAVVAELRAPVGLDATTTASPGASRMCDWGVLLYRIDVTVLNAYGSIKVIDAMPNSTGGGCTGDVDIATLGKGQGDGPSKFVDPETGTAFEVVSIQDGASAKLRVTRAVTRITAKPGTPLSVDLTGAQFRAPATATYHWTFGDATTGEGATASHAYGAPGRYPVTLAVRDGDKVLGTATQTVTAYGPAAGTVAVQTSPAVAGSATTVTATAAGGQDMTFEVRRRDVTVAKEVVPVDAQGRASFTYSNPVAATDTVIACLNASQTCGTGTVEWAFKTGGAADLWDGETLAGWSTVGAGTITRNYMASLGTSAGTSTTNPGVLWYGARKFKDFELSVDYRVAAVGNNGGVLLRFPEPANVAAADSGYQVAILDNGTATTRTGAITQERGPVTSFAPSTATNFKPTREWNTLTIRAVRHHIEVRLNGTLVSEYHDARRNGREGYIGLENAGNNLMYRHVRITELAPDTVAPTVTIDAPADGARILRGAEVPARFGCADESELESCAGTVNGTPITAGANLPTATAGPYVLEVVAKDAEGHVTTRRVTYHVDAWATGAVGGSVPATLSLTLGAPATFPAFIPGVANDYAATTTATVTSTAGDATLSVSDPGHLANGAFTLAEPLRVAFSKSAWTGPASNETVNLTFRQLIKSGDPLRTGTYAKTLTFTLATTNP